MVDLSFVKTDYGVYPASKETEEYLSKLKYGEQIHGDFKKRRNVRFHRKFFALLNVAFDMWEPGELANKYGKVEKNFDQFRHDIVILAGYYNQVFRTNGDIRVEAKSISFSKMDESEFEMLYSSVIDVVLKHICTNIEKDELQESVDQVIGFA